MIRQTRGIPVTQVNEHKFDQHSEAGPDLGEDKVSTCPGASTVMRREQPG